MIERDIIGIFGKMNAGKSSLMNLLTQNETSIVDATPGTTADTKITLAEIHGLGPVKLMDTAGFDEEDELGEKKRVKIIGALKECDLVLLVIDTKTENYKPEEILLSEVQKHHKQIIIIYNHFIEGSGKNSAMVEASTDFFAFPEINLCAANKAHRSLLLDGILKYYLPKNQPFPLIPFLEKDEFYILNIPMDEETPDGRFLRPQAMAVEHLTRNWTFPVAYRMDLKKARSGDIWERKRWDDFLNSFTKKPKLIITDSQAIDILKDWAPNDIALTTFSIMMINYMSRGNLIEFVSGVKTIDTLKPGDEILIAEACHHSRINEDIGTKQIPDWFEKHLPGIKINHLFGKSLLNEADIKNYKLVIHCGGCMISAQQVAARIHDLKATKIPVTNYGIFLSYIQKGDVLKRVIKPWM